MAGDMSIGCAALKRSTKLKSCTSGTDTDSMQLPNGRKENGHSNGILIKPPSAPQNMRGGLRVYKIVILGDGGVGKSGKFSFESLLRILHFDRLSMGKINKLSQFLLRFVLRHTTTRRHTTNHPQPTPHNQPLILASCVRQTLRVHTHTQTYTVFSLCLPLTHIHGQQLLPCSSSVTAFWTIMTPQLVSVFSLTVRSTFELFFVIFSFSVCLCVRAYVQRIRISNRR